MEHTLDSSKNQHVKFVPPDFAEYVRNSAPKPPPPLVIIRKRRRIELPVRDDLKRSADTQLHQQPLTSLTLGPGEEP